MYPLLRRLSNEGLIEASWQPSPAGPVRKYYRLRPEGEQWLERMEAEWHRLTDSVAEVLGERSE